MNHVIRYFGNIENFPSLTAATAPQNPLSKNVTGLLFRYMEMPKKEFVGVGVEEIVLRAPVLLIPERHTDGKGFMEDPQFEDKSAMNLLVDMIIANPEHRDALGRLIVRLGGSEPIR